MSYACCISCNNPHHEQTSIHLTEEKRQVDRDTIDRKVILTTFSQSSSTRKLTGKARDNQHEDRMSEESTPFWIRCNDFNHMEHMRTTNSDLSKLFRSYLLAKTTVVQIRNQRTAQTTNSSPTSILIYGHAIEGFIKCLDILIDNFNAPANLKVVAAHTSSNIVSKLQLRSREVFPTTKHICDIDAVSWRKELYEDEIIAQTLAHNNEQSYDIVVLSEHTHRVLRRARSLTNGPIVISTARHNGVEHGRVVVQEKADKWNAIKFLQVAYRMQNS